MWKQFLNKKIKIIYDDGGNYPSKKIGLLIGFTNTHLILKIDTYSQAILLSKIIRVEEIKDE
jgi:hypothetical protein